MTTATNHIKPSSNTSNIIGPIERAVTRPTQIRQSTSDQTPQVSNQRDINGINYARKSMIRTGLSLNADGIWSESQLSTFMSKTYTQKTLKQNFVMLLVERMNKIEVQFLALPDQVTLFTFIPSIMLLPFY